MNFLSPYLGILKAVAIIAAALFVFKLGAGSVQSQWDRERMEQANATLQLERETRRAVDAITTNSQREKASAKTTIDNLRADLRDRSVRLSVAVDSCTAADPGSGHSEARADILPAAADRIVGIIGEADDAVLDLNECVDKYNAVRIGAGSGKVE
jgi:hypothetical protein